MEGSLLKKESYFHKLNAALELKAQGLFQEADTILKLPNTSEVNDVPPASYPGQPLPISTSKAPPATRSTIFTVPSARAHATSVNVALLLSTPDDDLDCEIGPHAALRLVKVKSQMLLKERDSLQIELKKQTERSKKKNQQLENLRADQARWQRQTETAQHKYHKQQQLFDTMTTRLETQDIENSAFRKDIDTLKRQLKQTSQDSVSNKVLLNRCVADNEKLKMALKTAVSGEREVRETSLQESEQLQAMIVCLEKQKAELMQGIKKQVQLIENLKQQLIHLEVTRFVKFAEEEFSRILDKKMENNAATTA